MKKLLILGVVLVIALSMFTFVYADGRGNSAPDNAGVGPSDISGVENQVREQNQVQEQLGNQIQAGTYNGEYGTFQIQERENKRIRLISRNISADCDETCNMTQEREQNRTRLKIHLSNGINAEIKVMPDTASETALARLRIRVCNETNNCTIVLKETGTGNQTRAAYEIQVQRRMRILGLFQTKTKVMAQVDVENGEVLMIKKPWWAFLATQPEE